jgi:hypothetical protein
MSCPLQLQHLKFFAFKNYQVPILDKDTIDREV